MHWTSFPHKFASWFISAGRRRSRFDIDGKGAQVAFGSLPNAVDCFKSVWLQNWWSFIRTSCGTCKIAEESARGKRKTKENSWKPRRMTGSEHNKPFASLNLDDNYACCWLIHDRSCDKQTNNIVCSHTWAYDWCWTASRARIVGLYTNKLWTEWV